MNPPRLPAGTRVGDFVVDALIGVGGMGHVYRAHQIGVNRPVALKILVGPLAADPDFVARFQREASMIRDLEHPAVLTVYATGEDAGTAYLATRLVTGPTLKQLLADGALPAAQTVMILRPIADGLDHAHSRGVIHRDVKPANVLLDPDGRPFLADFGISKELGVAIARTGQQPLGTPRYMAPEQAVGGGGVGHRADLYSLACVAFEMLTGSVPYTEVDPAPLMLAHANEPIPRATALNPELPAGVDRVFDRGLAKDPDDRFPSAQSLVDALAAALHGGAAAGGARPDGDEDVAVDAGVRRRARWLVGGGMAAIVVAGVVALVATGALAPTSAPQAAAAPTSAAPASPGSAAPPTPASTVAAAPTTPPPAAPATPSPALLADVPRGRLLYEAALNGTPRGFDTSPAATGPSSREAVRFVPGALELEALAPGADTYTQLDVENGVQTYIGEMDLAVRPGTDVELCWSLRWAVPRQLSNYWCVATRSEAAQFSVYRRGEGRAPIGAPVPLRGLQSGRPVRVALVVRDRQLSMYVGGQLVADVVNDQVPVSGTLPGIEMESETGTGLVRIEGLRIYALGRGA